MSGVGPYSEDDEEENGVVAAGPDADGVYMMQGTTSKAWIRCENPVEVPIDD